MNHSPPPGLGARTGNLRSPRRMAWSRLLTITTGNSTMANSALRSGRAANLLRTLVLCCIVDTEVDNPRSAQKGRSMKIDANPKAPEEDLHTLWHRVVGRRSFLKGVGVAGAAALPATALGTTAALGKAKSARI